MKMSNDMDGFEKEWGRAFQNPEIKPPDSVWDNIESSLDSEKKRAFIIPFYKISIAASLLIATSLGIYFGFFTKNDQDQLAVEDNQLEIIEGDLSSNEVEVKSNNGQSIIREGENLSSIHDEANGNLSSNKNIDLPDQVKMDIDQNIFVDKTSSTNNNIYEGPALITNNHESVSSMYNSNLKSGFKFAKVENIGLNEPTFKPGLLAEIPEVYRGYDLIDPEDEKNSDKFLIAGLNFSSGTFNPNVASNGNTQLSSANFLRVASSSDFSNVNNEIQSLNAGYDIRQYEELSPSVAYSYGANVGFALTSRIVIYSGINYTQANSKLNTDLVITQNGQVLADNFYSFNGVGADESSGDSYGINNGFEFLSIPVKAGYAILNKDVNITLLGGVSTEFLLSNSYSSNAAGFDHLSNNLNGGNEEFYNPVYFNGLLGFNVGYTFIERYHLFVEPSFSKAISQFTKQEFNLQSSPSYKMLMVGVSYRF